MNSNKLHETKVMAKTKEKEVLEEVKETNEEQSPWYYFYSVGCGFCKKAEPIIDELIKEGHNILKLDMAEGDNQKLKVKMEIIKQLYMIEIIMW